MAWNKPFYFFLNVKIHPLLNEIKKPRMATLQGNNISHLGKFWKSSTQNAIFGGYVSFLEGNLSWRGHPNPKLWGIWPSFQALFVTSSEACSSAKFCEIFRKSPGVFRKITSNNCWVIIVPIQNNNALLRRNPLRNYHTFASFDAPKMGDFIMSDKISGSHKRPATVL